MRPGNNNRRGRNRGQRKQHGGIPNKNQSYDGGGSETRVRGNVYQVLEKYLQLARDAGVSGDRIAAENYLQHADHYYRVIQSMNDGQRPRVGGRDISVADFNVQNVSQGLSAALYTGGQAPQPNLNEGGGNQAQPQGNAGNANAAGNGTEEGTAENGDDGDEGDEFQPQQAQQGRDQNREQGRDQGRNQRNRYNNNRQGQYGNGQHAQNGAAPEGERPRSESPRAEGPRAEQIEAAAAPAPAATPGAPVGDDQPDYPEHLLAQPGTPEAGQEGRADAPRGRGRQQRGRRPRAGGDQPVEPAVPVTEGSE